MTPNETQTLAADVAAAKARFSECTGRTVSDDEFALHFAALERKLAGETAVRIDRGSVWANLPERPVRALRRFGHVIAAELAATASIDLEALADEIAALAVDDDALADELRAALVEQQVFQRLGNGDANGIDTHTIVKAWAAASIRARAELATRERAK